MLKEMIFLLGLQTDMEKGVFVIAFLAISAVLLILVAGGMTWLLEKWLGVEL